MSAFTVRAERPQDADAVRAVVSAAFGQGDEAALVDELHADGDSAISFVAMQDDAIVGHILFSKLRAPARILALAPLSVAPSHQKRGIGGALVKAGLERAAGEGWAAVIVVGDPAYYTRFVFSVAAAATFGTPYPKEYVMALALAAGANMSGAVVYAPAFASV